MRSLMPHPPYICNSINYKNSMIRSAHKRQAREAPPSTACKQPSELSELSVSFSEGQAGESSNGGGVGLLECLMSSESGEIQRLSSMVRLLTSRNHYLQKDNELLQNQIAFLNQRIAQLSPSHPPAQKTTGLREIAQAVNQMMRRFDEMLAERLRNVIRKEMSLEQTVSVLRDKIAKYKVQKGRPTADNAKIFKLEIDNTKLRVRVSQLQKSLEELGLKYIQNFEWRPYLIPNFTYHQEQTSRTVRDDLKLDLKRLTQSSALG